MVDEYDIPYKMSSHSWRTTTLTSAMYHILNRPAYRKFFETQLDMSICSPELEVDVHWTIANSPGWVSG